MRLEQTEFPGLCIVHPDVYGDSRGYFLETYSAPRYADFGIADRFVQDNMAVSKGKGVLRGLHFQAPPCAQSKLVRVALGRVLDVVVDLRKGSPTFGKWFSVELSAENHLLCYIPRGFAHAYLTLSDQTIFEYKVDARYAPECERGLKWDDPDLGIRWPAADPLLSDKDKGLPSWADFDSPFTFGAPDAREPQASSKGGECE